MLFKSKPRKWGLRHHKQNRHYLLQSSRQFSTTSRCDLSHPEQFRGSQQPFSSKPCKLVLSSSNDVTEVLKSGFTTSQKQSTAYAITSNFVRNHTIPIGGDVATDGHRLMREAVIESDKALP